MTKRNRAPGGPMEQVDGGKRIDDGDSVVLEKDGEGRCHAEWTAGSLTDAGVACNGARWWAQRLAKRLASLGCGGTVAFPEREGGEVAERRLEGLRAAAGRVAASGEFGRAECHVRGKLGFETAYRGVGGSSPAVEVDGVSPERMVAFAKTLCEVAGEDRAVVWEGVDCLQSVEGGGWEGDAGEVWWLERGGRGGESKGREVEEPAEKTSEEIREAIAEEAGKCGEWFRRAGRVVVARARVEDLSAPEGVFRMAWRKAGERPGRSGMMFVLRWKRKGGGMAVERVLAMGGASVAEVGELVAMVPDARCQEVRIAGKWGIPGDGWLEEVFGERPEGEEDGEWSLVAADKVEAPRASVFGWHDTYRPVRIARIV